jgi:hypothetical protein
MLTSRSVNSKQNPQLQSPAAAPSIKQYGGPSIKQQGDLSPSGKEENDGRACRDKNSLDAQKAQQMSELQAGN